MTSEISVCARMCFQLVGDIRKLGEIESTLRVYIESAPIKLISDINLIVERWSSIEMTLLGKNTAPSYVLGSKVADLVANVYLAMTWLRGLQDVLFKEVRSALLAFFETGDLTKITSDDNYKTAIIRSAQIEKLYGIYGVKSERFNSKYYHGMVTDDIFRAVMDNDYIGIGSNPVHRSSHLSDFVDFSRVDDNISVIGNVIRLGDLSAAYREIFTARLPGYYRLVVKSRTPGSVNMTWQESNTLNPVIFTDYAMMYLSDLASVTVTNDQPVDLEVFFEPDWPVGNFANENAISKWEAATFLQPIVSQGIVYLNYLHKSGQIATILTGTNIAGLTYPASWLDWQRWIRSNSYSKLVFGKLLFVSKILLMLSFMDEGWTTP